MSEVYNWKTLRGKRDLLSAKSLTPVSIFVLFLLQYILLQTLVSEALQRFKSVKFLFVVRSCLSLILLSVHATSFPGVSSVPPLFLFLKRSNHLF